MEVEEEDSDLQDLISPTSENFNSTKSNCNLPAYYTTRGSTKGIFATCCAIPELICYYTTAFLLTNPLKGKCLLLSLLVLMLYGLLSLSYFTSNNQSIGVIKYDFTNIHSALDFDISKVDHWCITGGDEKCRCEDPLHAVPKMSRKWMQTHEADTAMIRSLSSKHDIDVVFVGQSVVEVLNGRIRGTDMVRNEYFGNVRHAFAKRFQDDNASIKGVALGMTGDHSANVLWRLLNGELPDDFDPPIWWVVVGMEDIAKYQCSEEITVMGVLRIVEEIKKQRPNAKVVINSLFPMTKLRFIGMEDSVEFMDAERGHGLGPKKDKKEIWREKREQKNMERQDKQLQKKHHTERQHHRHLEDVELNDSDKLSKRDRIKKEHILAKKQKDFLKALSHDKYNPNMDMRTKFNRNKAWRKHDGSGIPVWTAIHEVNAALHKFAKKTPHVTFFDVTSVFAEQRGKRGGYTLISDYISSRGHPTVEGFKLWLSAVEKQMEVWKQRIIEAQAADNSNEWRIDHDIDYYYDNNNGSGDGMDD